MTSSNATAASNPLIPLVRVPIAELRQDPRNARSHDRRNLDAIKASLEKFGQVLPVVVRAGQIVGGNATTIAADELGWTHLDVSPADHLSPEEAVALAVALNRTAELASWDAGVLVDALQGLPTLEGTGFSAEELAELEELIGQGGGGVGLTDPDEVPEPPVEPVTRPGDLWLLGPHRLLCGDATKAEDVERLMAGERALLLATDPPFLVDYGGGNHPQSHSNDPAVKDKQWDDYQEHAPTSTLYRDFMREAFAHALTEKAVVYQWHADRRRREILAAWEANDLLPHQVVVWVKSRPVLSRHHFMGQHEPALYGWQKGKQTETERRPPANATTFWQVDKQGSESDTHPTEKPVELFARPMRWHLRADELAYEPFNGSGSALIAAHLEGRRCYALEVSPRFVDQAARRWQEHTGEKPILEATGEPHDFTSAP